MSQAKSSRQNGSDSQRILSLGAATSILRNLGAEDRAYARELGVTEGEDMQVYVDSPVTIQQSPRPERSNSSLGTVAKLALGAGLLATGAGAGVAIPLLLDGGKEIAERVETIDNTRRIVPGFGQPD